MTSKEERKFLDRLQKLTKDTGTTILSAGENAVMEGFEYFSSPEYKSKPGAVQSRSRRMMTSHGLKGMRRIAGKFVQTMPSMFRNINRNFTDMDGYLETLETGGPAPGTPDTVLAASPNTAIWEELKEYAWTKHKVIVGFTEVPREYIFKGKAIPFGYALVFAREMRKDAIEKAPDLDAGIEVITVYNSLGIATNDIAAWLRENHGIVCMANHPLGGLVDTVPLAEKAGLGAIGRNGLLITEEFGPRCRISPVFVDEKIFDVTDSTEHDWLAGFCARCGSCRRSCPTRAIYETAELDIEYHNRQIKDRYRTYDREKCFTSFSAHMGCSICISVCPYSKDPGLYKKMKTKYQAGSSAD